MEILSILLATIVSATLAFLFKIVYSSKSIQLIFRSSTSSCPLPPGNMGWPVLGESLEFISNIWKGSPERFIHERISRYGSSTFKTSLIGDPTMVMYGAAGNKFLFSNEGKLVRTWWPKTISSMFPKSFMSELRFKDLAPSLFLKSDRLQSYVGIMDTMARTHLDAKWHAQNQVMVYRMAKDYAFTLACRLFLSTQDTDFIEELNGPMSELIGGFVCLPINLPWTRFGRAMRASKLIISVLETVIRKRRHELASVVGDLSYEKIASNQDILSSMLLNADENGMHISDNEMAEWIMGVLIAGHDTSTVVISMTFKYIGENPEIYQKVFQEQIEIARNKAEGELLNWHDISKMKYSWNVAQEAMRLYPPAQAVFREATSDFTYDGFQVPKGWKLHMSIHATHRDSNYFPDPERFDPSRFEKKGPLPYTFLPFGGGPNMCPGMNYAKMEILAFLHNVVKRYGWENMDEQIILDPFPKPANGLPIRLRPH